MSLAAKYLAGDSFFVLGQFRPNRPFGKLHGNIYEYQHSHKLLLNISNTFHGVGSAATHIGKCCIVTGGGNSSSVEMYKFKDDLPLPIPNKMADLHSNQPFCSKDLMISSEHRKSRRST